MEKKVEKNGFEKKRTGVLHLDNLREEQTQVKSAAGKRGSQRERRIDSSRHFQKTR